MKHFFIFLLISSLWKNSTSFLSKSVFVFVDTCIHHLGKDLWHVYILNFGLFKPKYLLIPTILMKKKRFGLIRFHCTWKKLCLWMQTQTLRIYLHITICVPYRGNRSKGNLSTGWNQWTAVWNSQRKPEETFQTPLKVHIVCLVHNVLNVLGNAFYGK